MKAKTRGQTASGEAVHGKGYRRSRMRFSLKAGFRVQRPSINRAWIPSGQSMRPRRRPSSIPGSARTARKAGAQNDRGATMRRNGSFVVPHTAAVADGFPRVGGGGMLRDRWRRCGGQQRRERQGGGGVVGGCDRRIRTPGRGRLRTVVPLLPDRDDCQKDRCCGNAVAGSMVDRAVRRSGWCCSPPVGVCRPLSHPLTRGPSPARLVRPSRSPTDRCPVARRLLLAVGA